MPFNSIRKLTDLKIILLTASLLLSIACSSEKMPHDSDKPAPKPVSKKTDPDQNRKPVNQKNFYKNVKPMPLPTVDDPGTPTDRKSGQQHKDTDQKSKSSPAKPPKQNIE